MFDLFKPLFSLKSFKALASLFTWTNTAHIIGALYYVSMQCMSFWFHPLLEISNTSLKFLKFEYI